MPKPKLTMIECIDAGDFPEEVSEYLMNTQGISDHYQNDIISTDDDGNPFAEWLKSIGYKFPEKGWGYVAMFAT